MQWWVITVTDGVLLTLISDSLSRLSKVPISPHVRANLMRRRIYVLYTSMYLRPVPYTAKTKCRKFETHIPRKGKSGPQSQFPHSCVCERIIYFHVGSAFSAGGNMWCGPILGIYKRNCRCSVIMCFGHPIWFVLDTHCNESTIYVFLFWELLGLRPNCHVHVSVSDLYISRIGPHILLQQNRQIDRGNVYVNRSQTHECGN